jgi:hypothetical protein
VAGVSVVRRIEIGSVAVLAIAAMLLGTVASVAGVQLPPVLAQAFSTAGEVLAWLRPAVVLALLYGVARARENP